MRSRFSAFVKRDAAYLYRTLHPQHDDFAQGQARFVKQLRAHLNGRVVYQKLEVLEHLVEPGAETAQVLFIARVAARGKDASFAELSSFAHDGVGYRYLAGRTLPVAALGPEPSAARIRDLT